MNLNHNGNARVRVKVICLVVENTYGNNLRKLLNRINENSEIKIRVLPFILLIFNNTLNSLWRVEVIFTHAKLIRDGISQNIDGRKIIPRVTLNQFNDKFVLVAGSNVENRFVIIFN